MSVTIFCPEKESTCIICLEAISYQNQQKVKLDCKHIYHKKCIDNWLENNPSCPLCRTNIESYNTVIRRITTRLYISRVYTIRILSILDIFFVLIRQYGFIPHLSNILFILDFASAWLGYWGTFTLNIYGLICYWVFRFTSTLELGNGLVNLIINRDISCVRSIQLFNNICFEDLVSIFGCFLWVFYVYILYIIYYLIIDVHKVRRRVIDQIQI